MQALHPHLEKDGFRLRGTEMTRVDGFSDVVFGFALTLLVVSLEVPHNFDQLDHSLRGFLPFAVCFTLLLLLWWSHFKFFRRYGLHDVGTVAINAVLLFTILFYVYPLKFLFTVLTEGFFSGHTQAVGSARQMRELMLLYGVGFAAVYLLFVALYANALRQRASLGLNDREVFLTRSSMVEYTLMGSVGLLSCTTSMLLRPGLSGIAGMVYFLLLPIGQFHARWERAHLRELEDTSPGHAGVDSTLNGFR